MELWMENESIDLLKNESIVLIEEVSKREDYRLIGKKISSEFLIDFLLEIIHGRLK
jgi:hypothetical protein